MDRYQLYLIPMEQREEVIGKAREDIIRAVQIEGGLVDPGELIEGVLLGHKDLWCIFDEQDKRTMAWAVTEIIRGTAFIWALGGHGMKDWFHTHEYFEEWARKSGCRAVQFFGRLPWERALKDHGYKRKLVVLEKEL